LRYIYIPNYTLILVVGSFFPSFLRGSASFGSNESSRIGTYDAVPVNDSNVGFVLVPVPAELFAAKPLKPNPAVELPAWEKARS
jgi:hypothetical protein